MLKVFDPQAHRLGVFFMTTLYDIARPFLFMALMAFTLGFLAYFAMGVGRTAVAAEAAWTPEPASASVVSSDPWNSPKPI